MYLSHPNRLWLSAGIAFSFGLIAATPAIAWKPGNNSKAWTKGATLNIFVDDIPADAPAGTSAAVDAAIKSWNDAQAPFGGLKLVRGATKDNADIHIVWSPTLVGDWGLTAPKNDKDKKKNGFSKNTVRVRIDYGDGLNATGITRIVTHELGHAEGLDHSADSDVMKENLNGKGTKAPTAADLNSTDPIQQPNDDDKAGKKSLWGTLPKLSESKTDSGHSYNDSNKTWTYTDHLVALTGAGLTDPVTEFTMELSQGITLSDIDVTDMPTGWTYQYFDGSVDPSSFNDTTDTQPSLLSFRSDSSSDGIMPGDTGTFTFTSLFAPGKTRAFTNSPDWDSDDSLVFSPELVPEPSTLALFGTGAFGLLGCLLRRRKKSIQESRE